MAKKKTKEKEQVKQAWTASDYLENRKKRVEGAKSYSAPKGETAGQISTRNIVQTSGTYHANKEPTNLSRVFENTDVKQDMSSTQKARNKMTLDSVMGRTPKTPYADLLQYMNYLNDKAEQQKQPEQLSVLDRRNIKGTQQKVSDEAMKSIRNAALDQYKNQSFVSTTPEEIANTTKISSRPTFFEALKNGLDPNNPTRLGVELSKAFRDTPNVVNREDVDRWTGKTEEQKASEKERLNQILRDVAEGKISETEADRLTSEAASNYNDPFTREKFERVTYAENPYEAEQYQPTDNAGHRLRYAEAARNDPNNPLMNALKEASAIRERYNNAPIQPGKFNPVSLPENIRDYVAMSPFDRQRYNEIYGEYGLDRAEDFRYAIKNETNKRIAEENYRNNAFVHNPVGRVAQSFTGGINIAMEGLGNVPAWALGLENQKANTVNTYNNAVLRQNSTGWFEDIAQSLAQTSGMMLPSAAVGAFTGGTIGSALFGASVGGNTYQETINEGYTSGEASFYAAQQAIDEVATEKLLGGINAYGDSVLTKMLGDTKIANAARQGLQNMLSRTMKPEMAKKVAEFVIKTGINAAGEAQQEFLQHFTERLAQNIILRQNNELSLTDSEAWEEAALGALNAIIMNSTGAASNAAINNAAQKQYDSNMEQYKQSLTPRVEGNNSDQVSDVVNQTVDALKQDREIDTSESTPEEAKKQTETLVNAIREEDTPEIEFNSKKLDNNSIDNVSQETENKNTVSETETENKLQKIAEDRIKKSEPAAGVNIEEELERRSNDRFSDDKDARTFYKAYFEDFSDAVGKDVTSDRLIASYDDNMAKAYDTGLQGKSLAELSQDKDFSRFDKLFPGLTDAMWQMGVRRNIENFKGFRATFKAVFGPQGQSAFDSMVRNDRFSGDADAFTRIYNAGRYGKDIDMAGDLSLFGKDRSTEIFNAGKLDAEADYEALSKYSESLLKNPKKARKGVFINTSERTSEGARKAVGGFVDRTGISVVLVDSRDRASMDSALEQLDKHGLVKEKATVKKAFMEGTVGTVDPNRAFIVIDINTDNLLNTLGHEITHIAKIYNPEGYKAYAQAVLRKLSETKGYNLEGKIAYIQSEYKKQFGQELSRELAEEEIVAEAADFLNDEEIVKEIVSKNRSFAEKFRDWLKSAAEMIKGIMDTVTSREEAKALRKDYNAYKNAAELWTRMIDNAAENISSGAEMESLIRNQLDLSEGMGSKVKVPGNPMSVEEIFSLDDELMDKSDKYDEATKNAWKNIIEAPDFVSLGFPKDDWYYTLTPSARKEYAYQLTHFDKKGPIGDSRYKSDDMNRLYDELVVNTPSEGVDVTVVKTADMINSLPEQTRFQMDKPIEKTKDLIAVHNLTTEQLLANIGLGGFPSPSIAIIKDSMAHTKYGDTSILFNRETIDPEFMRKNKVYGGDAWTPTFPRIEYKVNDRKLKQISKKIESLAGMNVNTFGHVGFDEDNVSEALSGKGTLAGTRYADAPIVKLAYLNDKGVNVDLKYTEETLNRKIDNSQLKALDKYFSDEELKTLASDRDYGYEHSDDLDRIREHVNEVVAESNKEKIDNLRKKYEETGKPFFKKNMDHYMNWFDEYTFRGDDLYDLANSLLKYRESGIGNAIDTYATTDYINELMEGREEDYKAWINSFFDGIVEKSGLWNGKDIYTSTGNRRSWEATHDDVTLENIVKAMNREDAKGDAFFSAMGIKAIATRDFSSIEDIHKHENQLQDINEEDYKKLLDEHSSRYTAIVNELIPKNSHNEFIEFEKISNIIADTIREKSGVKAIDKELRKWIPTVKPDTAQKLVDLMNDIADMPYGYFEAKPQRAVYLDEIAGVVLPDTASQQLINALNQKGIDYKQYEAGNDTDRTTKLNDYLEEKPEIRFQIGSYSVNGIDYKVSRDGEDAISENGSVVPILTSKILAKSEINTGNINDIEDKIELILRELNGKEVVIKSSGERVVFDFDFADEYVRSKSSVGLRKTNTRRAKFNAVSKIKEIIINADNQRYEENIKGDKKSNADRGLYKYDVSFWTVTDNGYDSYTGELVVRLDRDGTDYAYDIVKIKKTAVARIENEGSRGVGPQSVTNKISQSKNKNKKINRFNKRFRYQLDTSGRNLSSEQAEFFADSKVRDEDGRLMVMYHGTPNGSFNVFRNGINFFTPNKEYATQYQSPSQSSRTAGKTAEAPRTYEVYLNMTHPFDIRNAEDRKAFINDYVKGGWALGIDPYVPYKDSTKTGLPSWEEADNIYEWMEENDLLDKYDGIIVDEGGTESGFDRGISYVTFNPNQIKNIDNENPTDSDDIRYQLGIPSDMFYNEDSGDMRTEQANVYLTNMLQASKDHTPSESDIKKVVKEITDTYHSKMKKSELTRQLKDLYTYMRTNEHVDGAQVSETINAIARQVIREATFTDPQQQDIWDRFRKEMRDTDIYVNPEFVRDIDPDGMASLRKRYFGRVNLTSNPEMSGNDGIRTYIQLQQQFPDIYTTNVDDITSDADAIREILYGFEKARPREESVFGEASTEDEASQVLAERIMDAYFEVGNQSVKTQYQKTYKQLREEMKEDIIREYNDGLRAKQIDDAQALSNLNRSRKAGEISEDTYIVRKSALEDYKKQQNEAAHDLFMKKREKYVDRIQRNKYKDDIIKTSKQLAKMILSPTDKKHIPTEMVEPISKVLQYIDFSSNRVHPDGSLTKRTIEADEFHKSITSILGVLNKIDNNKSVYENNGETSYLVIDPDLMQNLRELSESFANNEEVKDNIDNLSTQNLRTVQQTLRALNQMVNNANRFISMERAGTVSELSKQSISDFDNSLLNRGKIRQKVDKIRRMPVVKVFDDLLTSGMLDAYTYFYGLGNTGMALYEDVRAGLDRKIRNTRTAVQYMEDSMERNNVSVKDRNKWENDLIDVELRAVPIGGRAATKMKVKLSAAQIMSLYLLNKRGQARMHLYADATTNNVQNGGFIIEPSGRNKLKMDDRHVFKVTEAEADALIAKLTPQQKAVADDIGRFLTEVTSKWGNEVTQKLYGYNKFEAKNYFPIKVDNSTIATTSSTLENAMFLLKNMGQTKSVQQRAYNPITLQNIFDVYCTQADDMGSYNAFVTSTADLQMWINYKGEEGNVKRALANAYGKKATDYFTNLLKDINMPRENGSKWDKAFGNLVGLQRGGAIWGNFRVAIQQPFAYVRAAATMDPKYLLQGLTLAPGKKASEEWELAKKYAPIAQWKDYGFFDIGVGPSMKRVIMGNDTIKDKVSEAGMMPASLGDTIAWVRLWYASQAQVKAEHPDLKPGSEEFYQEAGKVFGHVVDTTQVVDSVLHRSDVMKDKSTTVKNATAFLSEPTKTFNMMFRAMNDFVTAKGKDRAQKGKILASTTMVWAISQVVNSAVASLISAFRNHDKDKNLWEKYISKVIPDFIDSMMIWNSIPMVKQWLKALNDEDQDNSDSYELLTLIPTMRDEFIKTLNGKSKKGWWGLLYQASQLTTFWGGNNMQNPLRDIDGVIDNLLIRDNMKRYYPYLKSKYNMYATQESSSGSVSYPNLKRFITVAMKAYANGDKELGDKIVDDLIKRIPEEKVDEAMIGMRPDAGESLLDQSLDAYMRSRFSKFNKIYKEEEKTDESRELKRELLNELIDFKMEDVPEDRRKVYDLVEETGNKNYLPSVLDGKFSNKGEEVQLTSSEYQKYQDAFEKYYYKFMDDTIDMNESEEKHTFTQDKAKSAARALAEDMILSDRGVKDRDTSKIKNYIDTNGNFDAMVDALYEIKDLPKDSQAKKGDIVRNAVSSDSARRALWSMANSNFSEKSYTENVLKQKYQKK